MLDGKIKQLINEMLHGLEIEKILLFGSRAQGNAREGSDYDLLIILKNKIESKERRALASRIISRLAKAGIDADILVRSSAEIEYYKDKIGSVTRNAVREGIPI